jgi:pimeloyl-ACP methyl ester carboxylesterase
MAYDLHMPQTSLHSHNHLKSSNKEPILFLHGIFGSKKSYALDSKIIANTTHTPVYTMDLRNHGETEHAKPFNYDTLAYDIQAFCKDHGLEKVKLVGYSLGAKVSMLTTLRYPELIKSAVIIDNAPIRQPYVENFMKQYVKSMLHVLDDAKIKADDKDWKNKASESMKKFLPNGTIRKNLLVNLVNKAPKDFKSPVVDFDDGYIQFLNPVREMEEMAVKDVCDWPVETTEGLKFEGDIKFIRGLKSPFITKEGIDKINEFFPKAEFSEVNSNHDILDQRPAEYVRIISDFFNLQKYKTLKMSTSGTVGHQPIAQSA